MKSKRLHTSISDTKLHCSFSALFAPEISSVLLTISSLSTRKSHFFWRNTCGYWSNQKQGSKQFFFGKTIVSISSTCMEQGWQENKLFIWKEIAFTNCFIANELTNWKTFSKMKWLPKYKQYICFKLDEICHTVKCQ